MRALSGATVLLMMLGCGNKAAEGEAEKGAAKAKAVFACNAPSGNAANCVEWHGGAYDEAAAKAECAANSGTFAGAACPSEKRVGVCKAHVGTPSEMHTHWYASGTTPAEALKKGCEATGGNFTSP